MSDNIQTTDKTFNKFTTAVLFSKHHNIELKKEGLFAWPFQIESKTWGVAIYDKDSNIVRTFKNNSK